MKGTICMRVGYAFGSSSKIKNQNKAWCFERPVKEATWLTQQCCHQRKCRGKGRTGLADNWYENQQYWHSYVKLPIFCDTMKHEMLFKWNANSFDYKSDAHQTWSTWPYSPLRIFIYLFFKKIGRSMMAKCLWDTVRCCTKFPWWISHVSIILAG